MLSEKRRAELIEKRKELKRRKRDISVAKRDYRNANLIKFFNKPKEEYGLPANPLQSELLEAWDNLMYKVFVYSGANRTGKTTILTIITFSVIFGKWLWNDKKLWFPHNHPRKCRILGQAWEQHIKTVLIPELKKWWPKERKLKTKKNNNGVEYFWEDVATGSTLEIMSNQQDSDVMEGWSGDFIGYDEPPNRANRVACARGLIDRQGRELFAMTLLKEAWVHRDVIKAVDENGRPDMTVFAVNGDISVNVGFGITQEGVNQFAKTLTDEEKQARLMGVPSYMSGLVCPYFKRSIHVKERFGVPSNWIVDIAIDIHPRKEQAVLFVAVSPQQIKYGCYEIWMHGDGPQTADRIMKAVNHYNYRVGRIICDPLAKGDSNNENTTYDKMKLIFARHGYILETASKDKQSGIIEINNHLRGPNKEPSIFFFRDLVRTIHDIEGWIYDEDTQKPQKVDDDMCENLYRILLLDTKYVDPEDEEWEDEYQDFETNAVTGY